MILMDLIKGFYIFIFVIVTLYFIFYIKRLYSYADLQFERICKDIYISLLKTNSNLSIEQGKIIIYSIIDREWFSTLNKKQISDLTDTIRIYLHKNNSINEAELKQIICDFKDR